MNWGRLIVDAVFREGDKHSNHGTIVEKMIQHMVAKIRKALRIYRENNNTDIAVDNYMVGCFAR